MRTATIRILALCTSLLLAPGLWAQSVASHRVPSAKTLNISVTGTLGPVLSGSDPLGADGQGGTLTVEAKESLSPTKHTSNSATYTLPPGAMTITVAGNKFKSTSKSTMTVELTKSADVLTLAASGTVDGVNLQVAGIAYLQPNSWTKSVLKHPTTFTPSPQNLTPAKTANGPGSKVAYLVFGLKTILGLTGSASDSDSADWLLYDEQ